MKSLNIMTEPVELLEEKLNDLNIFIEDSTDNLRFSYDRKKAYRSPRTFHDQQV